MSIFRTSRSRACGWQLKIHYKSPLSVLRGRTLNKACRNYLSYEVLCDEADYYRDNPGQRPSKNEMLNQFQAWWYGDGC